MGRLHDGGEGIMSDLGLQTLNDDQLLDLLQEACAELGQRDPVVRNLAQKSIYAEAERIKVYKDSIAEAIDKARDQYELSVRKEVEVAIQEEFKSGRWNPMGSGEEADLIVAADREVKQRIVAEAQKALQTPAGPNLWLHIQPGCVKASFSGGSGQRQTESVGRIDQKKIDAVIVQLKNTLGV